MVLVEHARRDPCVHARRVAPRGQARAVQAHRAALHQHPHRLQRKQTVVLAETGGVGQLEERHVVCGRKIVAEKKREALRPEAKVRNLAVGQKRKLRPQARLARGGARQRIQKLHQERPPVMPLERREHAHAREIVVRVPRVGFLGEKAHGPERGRQRQARRSGAVVCIHAVHHVEVKRRHVVVHQLVLEEELAEERQILAEKFVAEAAHALDEHRHRHVRVHHAPEGRERLVERAHLPVLRHGGRVRAVLEAKVAHVEGVEPEAAGRGGLAPGRDVDAQVRGAVGGKVRAVAVPGVEAVGAERHAADVAR